MRRMIRAEGVERGAAERDGHRDRQAVQWDLLARSLSIALPLMLLLCLLMTASAAVGFAVPLRARPAWARVLLDVGGWLMLAAYIPVVLGAVVVAWAQGWTWLGALVLACGVLPMPGGLLALTVLVIGEGKLRQRWLRVGLLGIDRDQMAKLQRGHCVGCGYDLRGHEELPHGRCPECGMPWARRSVQRPVREPTSAPRGA